MRNNIVQNKLKFLTSNLPPITYDGDPSPVVSCAKVDKSSMLLVKKRPKVCNRGSFGFCCEKRREEKEERERESTSKKSEIFFPTNNKNKRHSSHLSLDVEWRVISSRCQPALPSRLQPPLNVVECRSISNQKNEILFDDHDVLMDAP